MKKKHQEAFIKMSCAVCTSCYRLADSTRPDKCYFGGPYHGYVIVEGLYDGYGYRKKKK